MERKRWERREGDCVRQSKPHLVSDDGVEVVDVHGLLAQLPGWLHGRRR